MIYRIMLLLFLIPGLLWAQPLDRVVAIVNNNVITARELNRQLEQMRQQMTMQGVQIPADQALRKLALDYLIDLDIQMQLAKKNQVTIKTEDVDAAQADIAKRNHLTMVQLREALEKQGMDWRTYRDDLKRELLITRVQQKAIHFEPEVSKKQIEDYIKTRTQGAAQSIYHLMNIVIPLSDDPTKAEVDKALQKAYGVLAQIRGGQNFEKLAFSESDNAFVLEGGDLGERRLQELPDVFAKAVTHMKKGEVAGPLRTGNGFQLIKLVDVRSEAPKQDPALLRQEARQVIQQRRYADAVQNWLQQMRGAAYIKIMDESLA